MELGTGTGNWDRERKRMKAAKSAWDRDCVQGQIDNNDRKREKDTNRDIRIRIGTETQGQGTGTSMLLFFFSNISFLHVRVHTRRPRNTAIVYMLSYCMAQIHWLSLGLE